jgi:hypothetical protein
MGALRTLAPPMRARSSVVNVAQMAQREAERVQLVCLVTLTLIAVRAAWRGARVGRERAGAFSNGREKRCGTAAREHKRLRRGAWCALRARRLPGAPRAPRAQLHAARPRGARRAVPRAPPTPTHSPSLRFRDCGAQKR